jgi:hypothetical protein
LRVQLDDNTAFTGGGGIFNDAGVFIISESMILNNKAFAFAGGIAANATVNIINSMLANNQDPGIASEIAAYGTVNVNSSTILNQVDQPPSVAIYSSGTTNIKNSIIHASINDCYGPITTQGYNLSSDGTCSLNLASDMQFTDPLLMTWISPTGRFLPLPKPNSPARDHGQCIGITRDLRGFPRPVGA